MSTSNPEIIPFVVRYAMRVKPKTVMDIGCGFGKYGFLLREYLEMWEQAPERYANPLYHPDEWQTDIIGIEGCKPLADHCERLGVYRTVRCADVVDAARELSSAGYRFDLALCVAVLEHLTIRNAIALVGHVMYMCQHILVAVPDGYTEQGALFGNPLEEHRSLWRIRDLENIGFDVARIDRTLVGTWSK